MPVEMRKIVAFLDKELDNAAFEDDSANGLQVQGPEHVSKVGLAVDACMRSFAAALESNCDLLVVHHGLFWSKGMRYVTGTNCYCWDCTSPGAWASNCCAGSASRPFILTVTCQ